ncbi:hypothetical protein DN752_18175 [Echinicola strongylocentroti]|uniref:DUF3347 domain-containing protein n=1 Tax=Echinicola strongylocentroti TaxID=1795355 RepID=A0A2Z4IMR3_9BACT|nr:DUF3347 domain-containing protein [Echinicola strongylocentroti]AWW31908.1 hypothetical protein DN752_18175 [Echinicola strongylocentroti]
MKKFKVVGSLLVLTMILAASCNSKKQEETHQHGMEASEQTPATTESGKALAFKEEKSDKVFHHYLTVKNALVEGDAAAASEGAKKLLAVDGFQGQEAAKKIEAASDIAVQRDAFVALSASVEQLVASQVSSGAVYKQYCPMAFEGKGGYWLSDQEAIRNPYYGDKMLTCGRVDKVMGEL